MSRPPRHNRRRLFIEQLEDRLLLTSHPLVNIHLEVTDLDGDVIQSVDIGKDFLLWTKVQDLRSTAEGKGAFAVYNDVEFAADMVDVIAAPTFNNRYVNGKSFNTATDGVIDEWGAFAGLDWLDTDEYLVSSVKMKAEKSGEVLFSTNPADIVPDHDVLLYNINGKIPDAQIVFGTTSLYVNYPPIIIDDGDPGFTKSSGWNSKPRDGYYGNDFTFKLKGVGSESVNWDFTGLASGKYEVWTTWTAHALRATQAPYTVNVDGENQDTVFVDQTQQPGETIGGHEWKLLGTYDVFDDQLKVTLTDGVDQFYVIADAVRIERVGDVVIAPEVTASLSGQDLTSGDALSLGDVIVNETKDFVFTVKNTGRADLTLGDVTAASLPAGVTIQSNLGSNTLSYNQSTTFTLRASSADAATNVSATLSFTTNDSDENPFTMPVSLNFVALPVVTIIDDGDSGFTKSSGWNNKPREGYYGNDFTFKFKGVGSESVNWDFTGLASGKYKVWTTWTAHTLRATQAPYTITVDGENQGTVFVDQTQQPGETIGGHEWESIGTFDVSGNNLKVTLTDGVDQFYVIADAVRIERVDDVG